MTAFLIKSDILTDSDINQLLRAEVDMIVLKDPSTAAHVAKAVQSRCSIGLFCKATEFTDAGAVDALFVAVDDRDLPEHQMRDWRKAAVSRKLFAVLGAAGVIDAVFVQWLYKNGFDGVLLDAGEGGRLTERVPPYRLIKMSRTVREGGLGIGFSGGLEPPDVPRLMPSQPEMLCFDFAGLSDAVLQEIRALVPRELKHETVSVPMTPAASGRDWIFVQDFVLRVEIGAYRHEHGGTQRVRFDVTAEVARCHPAQNAAGPKDMRDVVSYDLIMDGIRLVVARGHVVLAEALAEAVAQHVLRFDRVISVRVRVEKLDIAPCRVGVEIERFRDAAFER